MYNPAVLYRSNREGVNISSDVGRGFWAITPGPGGDVKSVREEAESSEIEASILQSLTRRIEPQCSGRWTYEIHRGVKCEI